MRQTHSSIVTACSYALVAFSTSSKLVRATVKTEHRGVNLETGLLSMTAQQANDCIHIHHVQFVVSGMYFTCEQHVEVPHTWVQVDGCAKEVESRGILLHGQVDQTQVVQHFPVKRRQVVRSLQTADGLVEK